MSFAAGSREVDAIDVSHLGVHHNGREAPLYWGMWGLIAIEATVFASLISTYLYLASVSTDWPPAGVDPPKLLLPTVNTVVLLSSSWFVAKADRAARRGEQRWLRVGLGIATALAFVFLAIKVVEYGTEVPYRWDSHAYGSIVWTLTGFHTAHVIALVLKTAIVEVLALRGYFDHERNLGVQTQGLYWHFVVAAWIPIYAVLYLSPRVIS